MIDTLKPYREYKESGLPWLDGLAPGWRILRGKGVFSTVDVRSETGKEEMLTVSASDGVVPRRLKTVTMFMAKSYVGHKLCWPGDVVVNSLWAWMQGLGVAQHHGLISSAYSVYRPRREFTDYARFFHYLLRSAAYKWELQTRSKGVWLSRLQLSDLAFMDMPIVLPPPDEQTAIVRFLDYANRRIRRFILAKQKLIKLLEEQKQAIIHRVITRGLNPTVRLKPFAIQGLGDIPEHWAPLQVRRLVSFVTSGSRGWAQYYSDQGQIFVQSGNLGKSMALDFSFIQHVSPPEGSEGTRTQVRQGDLLICITGALTGNVVFVDADLPTAYVNQHVALIRPRRDKVVPRFLAYVLHSGIGKAQFKTSEYGGTKQGLSLDDVKTVMVPLPPLSEQQLIVGDLDKRVATLTDPMVHTVREIALMREYRTRLVAEVVTGKLDVRAAAANLPEEADEIEASNDTDALAESEDDTIEADLNAAPEETEA